MNTQSFKERNSVRKAKAALKRAAKSKSTRSEGKKNFSTVIKDALLTRKQLISTFENCDNWERVKSKNVVFHFPRKPYLWTNPDLLYLRMIKLSTVEKNPGPCPLEASLNLDYGRGKWAMVTATTGSNVQELLRSVIWINNQRRNSTFIEEKKTAEFNYSGIDIDRVETMIDFWVEEKFSLDGTEYKWNPIHFILFEGPDYTEPFSYHLWTQEA